MASKFQHAIKYGIIAGVIIIVYFLLFYFVEAKLLFNPFVYWASVGIYLAIIWRALVIEKAKIGEEYNFRHALRTAFFIFVIANAMYYLFYYFLFALIDTDLVNLQKEYMAEALEARKSMLPKEQYESLQDSLDDGSMDVTPGGVVFTYLRGLIGNFILALGLAYFVNRQF
ncbi:MAG: DUF4199 domain-containing protein [Chitinophagales bacterium]|nr:DUF4199 domain-containing protein [Chitinophagales bacterium]